MVTVERLESTLNKTGDIINLVDKHNRTPPNKDAEEAAG